MRPAKELLEALTVSMVLQHQRFHKRSKLVSSPCHASLCPAGRAASVRPQRQGQRQGEGMHGCVASPWCKVQLMPSLLGATGAGIKTDAEYQTVWNKGMPQKHEVRDASGGPHASGHTGRAYSACSAECTSKAAYIPFKSVYTSSLTPFPTHSALGNLQPSNTCLDALFAQLTNRS